MRRFHTLFSCALLFAVLLTWDYTQGINPATGFNVYKQTALSSLCSEAWVAYGQTALTTQTFADTTLVQGQTYCYRVTAYNAQGESTPSNVVTFQMQTLETPTNLRGVVTQ